MHPGAGTALTRPIKNRLLARGSAAAHGKRNVFPVRVNAPYFFSSYVAVYTNVMLKTNAINELILEVSMLYSAV